MPIKKKIIVNGVYEYDLFITELNNSTMYHLCYNNSDIWNREYRNTSAMIIHDTCNGLKFTQRKKRKLDYDEVGYLKIILKHIKY